VQESREEEERRTLLTRSIAVVVAEQVPLVIG
jgi:hypothetical protein